MNEQDFFQNISTRLGRLTPMTEAPQRTEVGAPGFWRDRVLSSEERTALFCQALEDLGGQVAVVENETALRSAIQQRLDTLSPSRVGVWNAAFMDQYQLEDILAPYERVPWDQEGVAGFQTVDVAITGCAYAVADTGTLVMMSNRERGRSVAVLPTVHLVILHEDQIRTRLGKVLDELSAQRQVLPSSIHFISGPSRSSDIENDQTIGIHGPAAVMVFILRS